jgi:serine O-acetyltransferase
MDSHYLKKLYDEHLKADRCPSPVLVMDFFNSLIAFLFPEFSTRKYDSFGDFESFHRQLQREFLTILSKRAVSDPVHDRQIAERFFACLPAVKESLLLDVKAMYDGDPAAKSVTEVIRTYPGFYAIASYRLAHHLHDDGLTLIARIISENAHSRTGIDIHPAAEIGNCFCIDHGTGIVVGETTVIGNHVKLYQGVTLGALSVRKEDAAVKRHPVIEDHVVIYAGASILGGETVVGHHSIIGGNVWLTRSVPPHSKIYYKASYVNESEVDGKTVLNNHDH